MKTLLAILLLASLCASTGYGQTVKSLGYTTNGQVVYAGTNTLWFTNPILFDGGPFINSSGIFYVSPTNGGINLEEGFLKNLSDNTVAEWGNGTNITVSVPVAFANSTNAATTRTNLGIPLPALTNTNNADMMRALAGSTNTNEPFSGTITFKTGGDDVFEMVISNGIILSVQEP